MMTKLMTNLFSHQHVPSCHVHAIWLTHLHIVVIVPVLTGAAHPANTFHPFICTLSWFAIALVLTIAIPRPL